MIRSAVAIVAGYLVMLVAVTVLFLLTFRDPGATPTPTFLYLSIAYGFAFAVLGGFVTAAIAGRAEMGHALALAGLIVVLGIVSLVLAAGREPLWYGLSNLALGAGGAIAGGYLRVISTRRPSAPTGPSPGTSA